MGNKLIFKTVPDVKEAMRVSQPELKHPNDIKDAIWEADLCDTLMKLRDKEYTLTQADTAIKRVIADSVDIAPSIEEEYGDREKFRALLYELAQDKCPRKFNDDIYEHGRCRYHDDKSINCWKCWADYLLKEMGEEGIIK